MSHVSSAADLTASLRRTSGTRPPPLVGCSVTLLGDAIYVFGGRLVPTRTMVSTLYRLDLNCLEWSLLSPPPPPSSTSLSSPTTTTTVNEGQESTRRGREPPQARYFHSCCPWGTSKLVIFGGEGYNEPSTDSSASTTEPSSQGGGGGGGETSEESSSVALQTLDDLHVFNTETNEWEHVGEIKLGPGVTEKPKPRYAHLGVISTAWDEPEDAPEETREGDTERTRKKEGKSCLMIMGGQDIRNTYLHSTDILDLDTMTWIQTGKWDRHIGTYRAIATTSNSTTKPGTLSGGGRVPTTLEGEELSSLSWTEKNSLKSPEPLLLFSNFNFTQVRRDLDLLSSPLSSTPSRRLEPLSLSNSMTGASLPPGLRFPSGFQVGHHLIIFGTFLSQHVNNFAIWALDLGSKGALGIDDLVKRRGGSLEWMKVDPGSVLQRGSWNRAVGWRNNVVVLGDRERDIAADYDHRQTNFTHVAFVDLEAHGIYQPPPRALPPIAQSFGLANLAQPFLSDFEIVCSDGKRLGCSRKLLEDRWSWFHSKILDFRVRASGVAAAQQKRAQDASLENSEAGSFKSSPAIDAGSEVARSTTTNSTDSEARLTPRTLNLPEPSSVALAFLQYLYTLTLCTRLQLELPVLSALLIFSKTYEEDNLRALVVHALHETLSRDSNAAPAVYEAATLGGCTALQIRALKSLMSAPRNVAASGRNGTGGQQQQQLHAQAEPMARQGSQDTRGSTRPSNPRQTTSASASSGQRIVRSFSLSSPAASLPSPRVSLSPPSPSPSSPLPSTPDRPSCSAAPPLSRRRSTSSLVAIPSPDLVEPIPVPVWTTFGTSSIDPNHRLSSSSSASSWSTRRGSLFDSPPSSRRRTASSVDSVPAVTSSSNKSGAVATDRARRVLETQREEEEEEDAEVDESLDPHVQAPTSPVRSNATASSGELLSTSGGEAENGRKDSTKKHKLVGLFNGKRERGQKGRAEGAETWYPVFLDSIQLTGGDGTKSISRRKATPINLEHLARLEQESNLSLSPALVDSSSLSTPQELHAYQRPASSTPGDSFASPQPSPFLSPTSSRFRRESLDTPSPHNPSPLALTPNSATSLLSRPSSSGSRSSLSFSSTRHSVAMDRRSSSARSFATSSEEDGSDLVTPPMPSTAQFEPVVVVVQDEKEEEELGSLPPSPSPRFPRFFGSKKSLPLPDAQYSSPSLSASTTRKGPSKSPSSFHLGFSSKKPSSSSPSTVSLVPTSEGKQDQKHLEIELGSKLLQASGASDKEIKLRARSVGFQILKARESGTELPPTLMLSTSQVKEQRRVEYRGGSKSESKFSVESRSRPPVEAPR